MNPVAVAMAIFIRDLLGHSEDLIRIGRYDYSREELEQNFIGVDILGPVRLIGRGSSYDSGAEETTISRMSLATVTIDFYGDGAYTLSQEYMLRLCTQKAFDLISVNSDVVPHGVVNVTDVKQLTGQQYGERIQVEQNIGVSASLAVPTLRIDAVQTEIRNEQGIQG